jgi:hypothetical protein
MSIEQGAPSGNRPAGFAFKLVALLIKNFLIG